MNGTRAMMINMHQPICKIHTTDKKQKAEAEVEADVV
jgi:hypothetical protein